MSGSNASQGSGSEATILVSLTTQQETNIINNVARWHQSLSSQYSCHAEMENIDRIYMREKDWTDDQVKSRLANRKGDSTKIQNVTVPIVMPQVNSVLSYLSEVFLTGYPLFPVVSDPNNEDIALQLETIIQENAITTGWAEELQMFFRDGLKYNIHAIECDWAQRTTWTVETNLKQKNNAGAKKVLWKGNILKRIDLYNAFWDPRVEPRKMHTHGEFVGYTEVYGRVQFKQYCNDLYNIAAPGQIIKALNSSAIQSSANTSLTTPFGYYIPNINPMSFNNRGSMMDWVAYFQNTPQGKTDTNYAGAYNVTKVYAKILPADYGFTNIPQPNTPQVWRFIIVNGQVILTAERMTNIHGFLPIFFGQPINDGLTYQTKSFAANVADMQEVASALWAGHLASKRRLVGDRLLYDPSRISESAINSTNPAAKIPVRPSAYGKPLQEAVYPFPFRDDQTESLVSTSAAVVNMANLINGLNPAAQGQFVKGNKTRHEYDDVMGHGNGQNQQLALAIEFQVLVPMKEVIKLNVMQFQEATTIYNRDKGQPVSVKPEDLRTTAVHFKIADGLVPSDKITGDDLLQVAMQQMGTSPQLAQEYNIGDAFTYLMKTQGLDLTPFRKSPLQMQYEQQLASWQQVAEQAIKAGQQAPPQPQPSPELQQEQQQRSKGSLPESAAEEALETTTQ